MNTACPICAGGHSREIRFDSLVMPTVSSNPALHNYINYLCEPCGVVYQLPPMDAETLRHYYNSDYRFTDYTLRLRDRTIDVPVAIPRSGVSFRRFQTFYDMIGEAAANRPAIVPNQDDWMVDFGAYQGMFLYAARNAWNCRTVATDYNIAGITFARTALGIDEAFETRDVYTDQIGRKARFAVLIHAFEHLDDPLRFLDHLKRDVLMQDGYLYVEIPNVCGSPLSDPTHFFMYSPEGLRRIMTRAGFETIALRVHGEPATDAAVWENGHMNISALFALSSASATAPASQEPALTYDSLRAAHRAIARTVTIRHLNRTARAIARLGYYLIFVLGLESLSGRMARRVKNGLSQLFRPASRQS